MLKSLVTGAAGFIGHHLCGYLKERGHQVRAVDWRPPEYEVIADEVNWQCDMRFIHNALGAVSGMDEIWACAADMGGMAFILKEQYRILFNNALIDLATAEAAALGGVGRLMFASSACVYPEHLQTETRIAGLKERGAWTGSPDTAYGVEKLFAEEIYARLTDVEVHIARFHNIYGPEGTWHGGREKAPAWLCRLAAECKLGLGTEFQLHGDGEQTRTFCYIDDCLEMLYRLMYSGYEKPLNIGTDELVSINTLARTAMDIAGISVPITYDPEGPVGVRGRNADLSKMHEILDYEPRVALKEGLSETYKWIEGKVAECLKK